MTAPAVALDEVRALLIDAETLVRAVASGRQRHSSVRFRRVELRYVDVKVGRRLQVTAYDDTQAHIHNLEPGRPALAEVDSLLSHGFSSWHVETLTETVQLRVTKKGRALLHRSAADATNVDRAHDRAKHRRLEPTEPLFHELGVTSTDGRVKPSRMAKYRQVQDFLGALDPVIGAALAGGPGSDVSDQRPLRVVDLGCGNAYLTFAAFRYLTAVRQLPVKAVGVDLKTQAREHNTEVARRLGMAEGLGFVEGTIGAAAVDPPPDLVLALHACDTATDEALARAVGWCTPVILAAPCCHHDIQRQLNADHTPEPYRLLTRYGILRERFADVLTDALRAAVLRLVGYRVDVVEFVDSEHTPRNTMLRAVRTGTVPDQAMADGYRSLVSAWGVRPALAGMLAADYPELEAAPSRRSVES